jgi:hypothetical protein
MSEPATEPISALLADDHSELDRLADALLAEPAAHDAGRVFEKLDYFWARLAMHIRAEHLHLFPALRRAFETLPPEKQDAVTLNSIEQQIARLKSDHDFFMRELARAVKRLREARASGQSESSAILADVRGDLFLSKKRLTCRFHGMVSGEAG